MSWISEDESSAVTIGRAESVLLLDLVFRREKLKSRSEFCVIPKQLFVLYKLEPFSVGLLCVAFLFFSLAIVSRHWAGASNFPHQGAPCTVSQLTTSTTTVTCTWRPTTFNTNTTQQTASLQSFNSAISISHWAVQRPRCFLPLRSSVTRFHRIPTIDCLLNTGPAYIHSISF